MASRRSCMRSMAIVLASAGGLAAGAVTAAAAAPGPFLSPADIEAINRALAPIPLDGVPGEPIVVRGGGSVPGIPYNADNHMSGALPPFAVPTGGFAEVLPDPDRPDARRVVLYRQDASTYASGVLSTATGQYEALRYYDTSSQLVAAVSVTRPEPTAVRTSFMRSAHARLSPRKPRPSPSRRRNVQRANAWCGSGSHADSGWYLSAGGYYPFRINHAASGAGVTSILYGADNWNSHQNHCGVAKAHTIQLTYIGDSAAGQGLNGENTTLFNSLAADPNCAGALGCAYVWLTPGTTAVGEADVVLNNAMPWMVTGGTIGPSFYDVEGVATHEFGHVLGFAHVSDGAEVMNNGMAAGDTTNRLLGRGDQRYANAKY